MEAEIDPINVLSVKAVGGTKGAKAAFDSLETILPSLRGRRFYGTYNLFTEEYRACVATVEGENLDPLGLERWTIPGGKYVKRKIIDWDAKVQQLPQIFDEMASGRIIDRSRPSVEFYRSHSELVLYLPVTD